MCIKIIGNQEQEFDVTAPLENQIIGAKEILVSYDPTDPKIDSFLDQMEEMIQKGIDCKAEIKVKTNNYLNGLKLERAVEKLKRKLNVNEIVKGLSTFHYETNRKLDELSKLCMEKTDER